MMHQVLPLFGARRTSHSVRRHVVVGTTLALIAFGKMGSAVEPTDDSRIDLPSFGVRFALPRGWIRSRELHFGQLSRHLKVEDRKLLGMLEVEYVIAKGRSVKDVATGIAADRDGRVTTESKGPGGCRMVAVELPASKPFKALSALVIDHGNQMIVIYAGDADAIATSATIKSIVNTLALTEPISAVNDLELRRRPIPLLDSDVLVVLPEPFRIVETDRKTGEQTFGVRDLPSGHDEASMNIRVVPNASHVAPDKLAAAMAGVVASKFGVKRPDFVRVKEKPPTYISATYAEGEGASGRIVLIETQAGKLCALFLRTTATSAKVRDAYCAALEKVARSARISKEYGEGRRSMRGESDE